MSPISCARPTGIHHEFRRFWTSFNENGEILADYRIRCKVSDVDETTMGLQIDTDVRDSISRNVKVPGASLLHELVRDTLMRKMRFPPFTSENSTMFGITITVRRQWQWLEMASEETLTKCHEIFIDKNSLSVTLFVCSFVSGEDFLA